MGWSVRTSGKCASISAIVFKGGSPERFALVVAKGPVWDKIAIAILEFGTRTPMVVGSVGFITAGTLVEAGNTKVSAPGQYR